MNLRFLIERLIGYMEILVLLFHNVECFVLLSRYLVGNGREDVDRQLTGGGFVVAVEVRHSSFQGRILEAMLNCQPRQESLSGSGNSAKPDDKPTFADPLRECLVLIKPDTGSSVSKSDACLKIV